MGYTVPAGISNKHLHVSEADFKVLFGADAEMTHFKDLSQPGQFATEEKVDIVGPRGTLKGIRILGPYRKQTQVELARTLSVSISFSESPENWKALLDVSL